MSANSPAQRMAAEIIPPTASGSNDGTATSSTTSAASLNLGTISSPTMFYFQPRGGNVYVRFGSSATTATTTGDTGNGLKLVDGYIYRFMLNSNHQYVDHKCDAASKALFWWKGSRADT